MPPFDQKPLKIAFAHALVFKLTDEGRVLTPGGIDNNYLKRFSDAGFGEIYLISRSSHSESRDVEGYDQLENINPFFLNKYTGGYRFLLSLSFYRDLYRIVKDNCLLIINYPSSTGMILILFAFFFRLPYVVEVASDANTYREKRFGLIFEIVLNLVGKLCVPRAVGSLYVAQFLRDKWGCDNGLVLSNVHIDEIGEPRTFELPLDEVTITTVGAISYRKGIDVIIDEFSILNTARKIKLNIIGPVIDKGLKQRIEGFHNPSIDIVHHGILKKAGVLSILDSTDLYIQASRSEGLPRSVIEAMSRGVPVLCSKLPGIRGVVEDRFQFNINRKGALRRMVESVLSSPGALNGMSISSINASKSFHIDITQQKRREFYLRCRELIS